MWRTRWRMLAIVVLVGIAPLIASATAVGAEPNPNKPIVLQIDETFRASNLSRNCGVEVWAHVFGTFTVKVLPTGVEHWRIRYDHVFSGPGGSFSVNHIENVTFSAITSSDGMLVESITATGQLLYHPVVPGHGSIGNNNGREILQLTWQYDEELGEYELVDEQLLFDSGPNDELGDEYFAVVCEIVA